MGISFFISREISLLICPNAPQLDTPPYIYHPSQSPLTLAAMGMFGNIKGLAFYQPGEADPYITINEVPVPLLCTIYTPCSPTFGEPPY